MEEKGGSKTKKFKISGLVEFGIKLAAFLLALFITFVFVIGVVSARSDSMSPNIKFRDTVVYSRMNHEYFLNDSVVYKYDDEIYIARIAGTPGDHIKIDAHGNLYRNEHLVYDTHVYIGSTVSPECDVTLTEGEYFVLADNRETVDDSRTQGTVSEKNIKGSVLFILRRFEV